MALFVQLPSLDAFDNGSEIHHKVASYVNDPEGESIDPTRTFTTGCGQVVSAAYHRLAEAETEPGGIRCTEVGCFDTAELVIEEGN